MTRKPVMVFSGEFWTGSSASGLADGFRELGWAVQEVDIRDFYWRPRKGLLSRVAARINRRPAALALQEELIKTCKQMRPDVFLTIKGTGITAECLRRIKETGARAAMFYPDVDFNHPGVSVESFAEFDLFVTSKTFQLSYLRELLGAERVAYVPHGFSSRVHQPLFLRIEESAYSADAIHVGSHSLYKQRWLESIATHLPEVELHLVGNRWHEAVTRGPLTRARVYGERVGVGYGSAIQSSRLNIAIHYGPTTSDWQDLVSTRTFEIPACRGFMLHIDNSEVREFFEAGTEIDVFSSTEELCEKVRFYLARPELRARMIERAYARCVASYSYDARARQIVNLLKQ